MSERTIWIVRIVAVVIFLLMAFLMLNLHTQLLRLKQQRETSQTVPKSTMRSENEGRASQPLILHC